MDREMGLICIPTAPSSFLQTLQCQTIDSRINLISSEGFEGLGFLEETETNVDGFRANTNKKYIGSETEGLGTAWASPQKVC